MEIRKLTRRQLAGAIAGALPLAARAAQEESQADMVKAAAKAVQDSVQALNKVKLPAATEPAFAFRTL